MREIPFEAIELVKHFESCELQPYLCPGDVWTIGWGHALVLDGEQMRGRLREAEARAMFPNGITREQADTMLVQDLEAASLAVQHHVGAKLTDVQFGALVSFVYNMGEYKFRRSTLLRKLNAKDYEGAAIEFARWKYSNGRELDGLIRRRKAEHDLFVGDAVG